MENTLYDKMLAIIHEKSSFQNVFEHEIEEAKIFHNLAIQAQIDLLEKQNKRLDNQYQSLRVLAVKEEGYDQRLNGKLEGVKLAIENNRQEIQELEKKVA